MRHALPIALTSAGLLAALGAACGSRTGLLVPDEVPGADAAIEDAGMDAPLDVTEPDAAADTAEPVDVAVPDVPAIDLCPDAGSTLVYVVTAQSDLYSFYPPTLAFTRIGAISCATSTLSPFSMAVDRRGIGYSVFTDGVIGDPGPLKLLDMKSAACQATPFVPGPDGFNTFGMGFVADPADGGETLFVAEGTASTARPSSRGLATIDPKTFAFTYVAPFNPPIPGPELTGTGSGQLFGFYTNATTDGSHVIEIDPATGNIVSDAPLQVGTPSDGYAFAFWGGVFWIFTSGATSTIVTRYDPATKSEMMVTTMNEGVVGAGVSTCAPQ